MYTVYFSYIEFSRFELLLVMNKFYVLLYYPLYYL